MKISFYTHNDYENLKRRDILSKEFTNRGHQVVDCNSDVLIIDHIYSQREMIEGLKNEKTVLIDGSEIDVEIVNTSVSAFYNKRARYFGNKYIIVPKCKESYRPGINSKTVFINAGLVDDGFATHMVEILSEIGLHAIVGRSINHVKRILDSEFVSEDQRYDAMRECVIGVSNYNSCAFEALAYGLPMIIFPGCEKNIKNFSECCIIKTQGAEDLKNEILNLIGDEYKRNKMSLMAQYFVDGNAVERICNFVEYLYG